MALLFWSHNRLTHPFSALPWTVALVLLAFGRQPAYLALLTLLWGLSLIRLVPGIAVVFGADPLNGLFGGSVIEMIALVIARLLLMITAWNQFMFYRLLYGTAGASGLSSDLPPIPEIIPNHSRRLAWWGRLVGFLALLLVLTALSLNSSQWSTWLVQAAFEGAILALGLGLGAAFSPIKQRGVAIGAIGLGVFAFWGAIGAGRIMFF